MVTVSAHGLEKAAIAFKARVIKVEQKSFREWLGGVGADAKFEEVQIGWFVALENSHESLFAGMDRPSVDVGDTAIVRVSFYGR